MRVAFIVTAIAITAPAWAHHGFGTFEVSKTINLPNATLTKVEFINPHSWLYFDVRDESGRTVNMRCEMRSAHVLRRSGWEKEMFRAGQRVDITASPDRADPASCYLQTIQFSNGTRMDRYGQYVKAADGLKEVRGAIRPPNLNRPVRRPNGEPNITGEWAPEQVVMADPRGTSGGLVPLSTIANAQPGQRAGGGGAARGGGAGGRGGAAAGPRLYGGTELTELGTTMAAAFTQRDNPRFECQTTSILFDWTFDGPVNRIRQSGSTITIEYGQMNLKRTIHMNQRTHPANVKPSRAGHSIGWWEGDTLVVDTVGFSPGVLSAPVRHSDKLHVVERFTLDPKTMQLTREYEAEDPVYLKGKYSGRDIVQPADAPYEDDNCKELKDVNYSQQQAARK